ncbi:hypothetical protein EIP91_003610 [Steccherinum ochraceum]|uniref:3'(2'),5'-bisphosphate nucleotidase n=1 Tax=Steccherinum ochraceum TaxID=92696 RepID=A0A4R0RLU4_9APHY|nr:hypothetical protein EIP91_003610 [Steccherinum ochraceum]
MSYAAEKQVAIAAVRRACILTSSVFNNLVKNETLTKEDASPVTVGDFAAQAVVNTILGRAFPNDPIVGEEDAADLRGDAATALRTRIVELANATLTAKLEAGEKEEWGLGPSGQQTTEQLLNIIDKGKHEGKAERMWTLDPIDGTKGFLRGEQYAVCLSLIVKTEGRTRVQLGVIGCPNLPSDLSNPSSPRGGIFVAVRGEGAYELPLHDPFSAPGRRLSIPKLTTDNLNLLESVEKAHSKLSFNEVVAKELGITKPPTRMDSQAKYAALARGDGGVYLRMPTGTGYREKIWDHAPGSLLVEEAGGKVTDSRGEDLRFDLGRDLGENYGVIVAGEGVHSSVLDAVKRALAKEKQGQ